MSVANAVGTRVAAFLRGHSGYPHIRWRYRQRDFEMPDGYSLSLITSKSIIKAVNAARAVRHDPGVNGVVYGGMIHDTDEVLVFLPIEVYSRLLGMHIDANSLPRQESGE